MNRPGDEGVCSSCGARLTFLSTKAGALMPAQKVTVLYLRTGNRLSKYDPNSMLEISEYWINHFQTCPHASDHHRKMARKDEERRPAG